MWHSAALDEEAGPNVKLFVSSTFTDTQAERTPCCTPLPLLQRPYPFTLTAPPFQAERNHLMQHVYPPLRTYCASLGLQAPQPPI